jgi:2-dehydropantoate 2-reductase
MPSLLPQHPTIAVVGAGAVGGYYGARLAQHGHDVHFLMRSEYEHVRAHGLDITSPHGNFTLSPVQAHNSPAGMPQADLVFVTLKTTSSELYEPLIRPLLKEKTAIFSLQNGLGSDEELARLFGAERILGGLGFVCINRTGPGRIHHITEGLIRLGEFVDPGDGPRAQQIVEMLRAAKIRCELLPNLLQGRWQKLVWNIPFNGLGAMLEMNTQQILSTERGREVVRALMLDVLAAARSEGVTFPQPAEEIIEHHLTRTKGMGAYQTSMQIDRQEGRPMEIEAIVGEPLRRAKRAGIATPVLEGLYRFLKVVSPES